MTALDAHHSADKPPIIYKYTDFMGAGKTLGSRTLRFACASEMNDPFDVLIDDWVGMDPKAFFEKSEPGFFEKLITDPQLMASRMNITLEQAQSAIENFRSMPEPKQAEFRREALTIDPATFEKVYGRAMATAEEARVMFAVILKNYGIFCATKTCANLLMWAHYADRHAGAVLGFIPNIEKDSMLKLIQPVTYGDVRPHIIPSPEEWVSGIGKAGVELARTTIHRLLHTKSSEWNYEQEWRLSIADGVKDGEAAGFFTFHPEELAEVYLGYRMDSTNRRVIAELAKRLNPDVQIYSVKLAKHTYTLAFERIAE